MRSFRNEKIYRILFWTAVFVGLFCFSFFAHPPVILDYDDWSYVSYFRPPVPWPAFWNPSRVLPECFMPFCGSVGALLYRVFPGLGYVRAESLVFSVVLAGFETVYFFMFARMLRAKLRTGPVCTATAALVFCAFHFLIFRTAESGNTYLFRSANLTCFFFYLIPALLNCILVMYFMSCECAFVDFFSIRAGERNRKTRILKKILILIAVYFAVFSNLFANVVLAVYSALEIGKGLPERKKNGSAQPETSAFLKKYALGFLILAMFAVSIGFEALGGRAKISYGDHIPLIAGLLETLESTRQMFGAVSIPALVSAGCILLLFGISVFLRHSDPVPGTEAPLRFLLRTLLSSVLIELYLIVLSSRVSALYAARPDVILSFFFGIFLVLAAMLACAMKTLPKTVLPAVILCLGMFLFVNTPGRTFAESYAIDCEITPERCIGLSQDLVDQVLEAEKEGKDAVTIDVLFTGDYGSNWPQVTYLGETLSRTLRKHGVIQRDMEVDVFPTDRINEKYGLVFELN